MAKQAFEMFYNIKPKQNRQNIQLRKKTEKVIKANIIFAI